MSWVDLQYVIMVFPDHTYFFLKGISDSLITSISYAFIYSIIFLIILPTKFSAWYQSISEFAKQGVTIAFRSGRL